MPVETRRRIAARAAELIGVPFRPCGRNRATGLDCIGVAAHALACTGHDMEIPHSYPLRGEHDRRIWAFFDRSFFSAIADDAPLQSGDILLLCPGPRQAHLAIVDSDSAIHAHAGLQRVVKTPLPLPWPITGRWRYTGV